MQKQKKTNFTFFSWDSLEKGQQALLESAIKARSNAQAPYSKFFVGAAVLSENGNVYFGCNVERCSYTQTTHAEQNAIDTMIANEGPTKIRMLAVVGAPQSEKIIVSSLSSSPRPNDKAAICGQCLQIIWENCFDDASVEILVLLGSDKIAKLTIGDLLPMPFGPSDLGVDYNLLRVS